MTSQPPSQAARPSGFDLGAALAVYILLTVLVWGLLAFDRGFFQDELWALEITRMRGPLGAAMPHRPLVGVPAALAWASGDPLLGWQALYGLNWLATGILAAALTQRILPGWLPAFLAGALVISATGDTYVNYLGVTSPYAVCAYLLGLIGLFAFQDSGRVVSLFWGVLCVSLGQWTADAILPAAAATPLLLWSRASFRVDRRLLLSAGVLWAALVPYVVAMSWFVSDPGGYASAVLDRVSPAELLRRAWFLFAMNYTPWRWEALFDQRLTGVPPVAVSEAWRMGLSLLGAAAVGVTTWRFGRVERAFGPDAETRRRALAVAAALAVLAFASNLGFAPVGDWFRVTRTNLVSRVLAAVSLALAVTAWSSAWRRTLSALGIVSVFVTGGIRGGLASQDLYLGVWRRQRAELRSLAEEVPGFDPTAWLVLRLPADAPVAATAYLENAQPWVSLLYGRDHPKVAVWNATFPVTACRADSEALHCRRGPHGDRTRAIAAEKLILLDYSAQTGRYRLVDHLPSDWPLDRARYAPRARLRPGRQPTWMRRLLFSPEGVARWFPAGARRLEGYASRDLPAEAYRLEWGSVRGAGTLQAGRPAELSVEVRNQGSVTWPVLPAGDLYTVRLGHRWQPPDGVPPRAYEPERVNLPSPLRPGGRVRLTLRVSAPSQPGEYSLQLDLVHEGVTWFENRGAARLKIPVRVVPR